ncbi:hypothetical protein [Murdochiella vaginalis]|uniref:hypothetical protein n=1 Tax=Murdochiella vaginalis TaxID=1852373 RepID=UPI0008FE5F8F|nr:hypothetical protein [Murdochiella vaginalis]
MENNNNGIKMLKVSSILLIIGGAIATILGIVSLLGVGALHSIFGDDLPVGLLYAVAGFALASGVLTLIAGIVGVGACKKPEKAGTCIILGVIVVILTVIGQVLNMKAGNQFDITSIVIGLLLPVVYIVGASQVKKMALSK